MHSESGYIMTASPAADLNENYNEAGGQNDVLVNCKCCSGWISQPYNIYMYKAV